ncbi:hypothetical protein LJC22_01620, partial [Desulfosarcina sp. OttesenSCG-928-G10]|nr:hypothetical protein [Desulfosarcina sp. OttesenSCG-928-G10]
MNRPVRILFNYDSKAFLKKWIVVAAICVPLMLVALWVTERNLDLSPRGLFLLIAFGTGCLFMLSLWRSRLMWEVIRMPGNCVASIEVDSRTLRVIKNNGADLIFPRERHSLAILVFQERGVDLFCLEIAYAYHTPQYFFLGRDKKNASTLLHALGLRRFEARFPVHTATGGWDAISKRLNALHFGEDYTKEMKERGQLRKPSRNKPVSENYSKKKKERLQFKKPVELKP